MRYILWRYKCLIAEALTGSKAQYVTEILVCGLVPDRYIWFCCTRGSWPGEVWRESEGKWQGYWRKCTINIQHHWWRWEGCFWDNHRSSYTRRNSSAKEGKFQVWDYPHHCTDVAEWFGFQTCFLLVYMTSTRLFTYSLLPRLWCVY